LNPPDETIAAESDARESLPGHQEQTETLLLATIPLVLDPCIQHAALSRPPTPICSSS